MKARMLICFLLASAVLALRAESVPPVQSGVAANAQVAPITKGLRVFTCGHSFHAPFLPGWLSDIAKAAGIAGHEIAGVNMIGGSRVIQHWAVPDEKNKAKAALRDGKVDVLTLSPMHQPDEGIDNFAKLALENNPNIRITVQEFWIPFDKNEWPFKGKQADVDPNAATVAGLRELHESYFKAMDDYVSALNKKLGKQALFVVPVGQAVIALREKVIAGKAPGIEKQSDLFTDKLGHPRMPIEVLSGYCHFAVIYRRSPVGLPMPPRLAASKYNDKDLNRLLQELAWDAVTHHPLSGMKSDN
ncbi:MAG TPA: hypothetical protein VGP72_02395 [Planctomycetota bacterium]|jgi:hypothetical protein